MTENRVSIFEFSALTGLSIYEIASLLNRGSLKFAEGKNGELLIDTSAITPKDIANEYVNCISTENHLVSETTIAECSPMLAPLLEQILEEATSLAFRWLEEDSAEQ